MVCISGFSGFPCIFCRLYPTLNDVIYGVKIFLSSPLFPFIFISIALTVRQFLHTKCQNQFIFLLSLLKSNFLLLVFLTPPDFLTYLPDSLLSSSSKPTFYEPLSSFSKRQSFRFVCDHTPDEVASKSGHFAALVLNFVECTKQRLYQTFSTPQIFLYKSLWKKACPLWYSFLVTVHLFTILASAHYSFPPVNYIFNCFYLFSFHVFIEEC